MPVSIHCVRGFIFMKGIGYMKIEKKTVLKLIAVVAGNFIYALTVQLFLLNSNLITGGTLGLALTANHLFGTDITVFVFLFNTAMLIVGWLTLGKAFALTTIASSYLYPTFMKILETVLNGYVITQNLMLNALFCGIGIGIALGIVIRAGSSTGGCDIPAILLSKKLHVPVNIVVYLLDMVILTMQLTFANGEAVLYGIVMAITYTVTMDKMFMLGLSRTEIKIVSPKALEISNAILERIDRGVTLLHGEGGYTHNRTSVVLTVVSNREVGKIQELVYEIDPQCFMVISHVSEVQGRGFSMAKDD